MYNFFFFFIFYLFGWSLKHHFNDIQHKGTFVNWTRRCSFTHEQKYIGTHIHTLRALFNWCKPRERRIFIIICEMLTYLRNKIQPTTMLVLITGQTDKQAHVQTRIFRRVKSRLDNLERAHDFICIWIMLY